MRLTITAFFFISLFVAPLAQSKEPRTKGEAAKELIARFPKWYAYEQISPDFVVFVPLDQDVVTKPVEGGMKRIAENPDIYLHGITTNGADTIRGELRFMKKDGKHDVFDTFKGLMDKQKVGDTYENIPEGDRQSGRYTFVYRIHEDEITYEKVINIHETFAISYRITTKDNASVKEVARSMVGNYTVLRRCATDNFGDTNCVVQDPKL